MYFIHFFWREDVPFDCASIHHWASITSTPASKLTSTRKLRAGRARSHIAQHPQLAAWCCFIIASHQHDINMRQSCSMWHVFFNILHSAAASLDAALLTFPYHPSSILNHPSSPSMILLHQCNPANWCKHAISCMLFNVLQHLSMTLLYPHPPSYPHYPSSPITMEPQSFISIPIMMLLHQCKSPTCCKYNLLQHSQHLAASWHGAASFIFILHHLTIITHHHPWSSIIMHQQSFSILITHRSPTPNQQIQNPCSKSKEEPSIICKMYKIFMAARASSKMLGMRR